jgi:lycopene cyclase-like protein
MARWPATYGLWADEVDGLGLGSVLAHTWPRAVVVGTERHVIDRVYGRVDTDALAARLRSEAAAAGVEVLDARVAGVAHHRDSSTVLLADRRILAARTVVDATGEGALVTRRRTGAPARQHAVGFVARFEVAPADDACVLMDWRPPPGPADGPPSFLYAQQLGGDRWFVEETVLASAAPVDHEVLRARLHRRLATRGAQAMSPEDDEHVVIPMGRPVPWHGQRTVGFGAAGGLVHPATGYSLAASLRAAPVVARALASARTRRATVGSTSRAAWDALWPAERRRARRWEQYGLEVLLGMDGAALADFFDVFFHQPPVRWQAYLSGRASAAEVVELMRSVYADAPPALRRRLRSAAPWRALTAVG